MAKPPGRRVKCKAHSKRTGLPCGSWAVTGWQVCRMHGARGGAPPEKLLGNTNSLKTGGRSTVAMTRFIAFHRVEMEAPVTPEAILRNLARTTHARIQFVYVLWFQAAEDLDRHDTMGNPRPEAFKLSRMVHTQSHRATGAVIERRRLEFVSVWLRWLMINEVLNSLEGRYSRIAEQLREKDGLAPASGTVIVNNHMSGVDELLAVISA